MTRAEMADEIARLLVERSFEGRIKAFGGYPDDVEVVGDHIVIATVIDDTCEPRLNVFTIDDAIARFTKAKGLAVDGDWDFDDAMIECGL